MKKLLILFAFLLSGILANGQQDVRPAATSPISFLQVPTYSWWYNKADSTIWGRQLNNSQIPEWVKFVGANRIWWTQIEKIIAGDTTFNRVHNRDSVNMTIYKLKDDSLKFYKLKTDSVTLKGYFTNSKARQYRKLNNHDSLSKLDERKYQSLTDTLTWGLGLSQTWHTVKVDTASASILSRQRALKEYEVKSNKVTSISAASTDIQYGSAKLLYDKLALYSSGTGTDGYIPNFHGTNTFENSPIFTNGTSVSIYGNVIVSGSSASTFMRATNNTEGLTNADLDFAVKNTGQAEIRLYGAYPLAFFTSNTQQATIFGNGNFHVGYTTNQGYKAAFNGTLLAATSVTTPTMFLTTGGSVGDFWKKTNANGAGEWTTIAASQVYNGAWNATTNTPTLTDGTGTNGNYYHCTVAGTQTFGGVSIDFTTGDDIQYNGSIWQIVYGRAYTLQIMSASVLGGAKIGGSLQINSDVLNISNADMSEITVSGAGSDVGKLWTIDEQSSAFWAGKVNNESGSGLWVFNNSPTFAGETILNGTFKLTNNGYFKGSPTYGYRFNDNTNTYNNYIIYENGDTYTRGIITTETTGTSTDWNEAHGWGNPSGVYLPLTGGNLTGSLQILPANSDVVWSGSGLFMENGTRIGIRAGTDYSYNIDMFNGGASVNAFKITQNGAITTGSTLYANGVISTATTGTSTDWNKYNQWDGGATGLVAATGRTSLGLGTAATTAATDYATAAQANANHSGDATGATALTLATVNANVGTWNNITINGKGLATAGSNVAYEPALGNPGTTGYVLSSTTAGVRSWVAPGAGGMVYPSGTGVTVVTSGASWGTTLGYASANTASALVQRDASGNFTAGIITATNFQLSDIRLKKNINSIDFKNLKTDKVQWIQYIKKDDKTNTLHYGVSAQKLEKVFPQFVNTATDSLKTKSVNYTELLVLKMAVMEIKQTEMQKEIKVLQNKVSNLERKYNRRKNEN